LVLKKVAVLRRGLSSSIRRETAPEEEEGKEEDLQMEV